jgi:membrane-associated protein
MLINFILHIDQHIYTMAQSVGSWTYLLLFLIIFVETAAVVMPFLPGDSLLFAAGALAANPEMPFNIWIFLILFFFAAFLGDTSNFFIGHTAGYKLINHKFFSNLSNLNISKRLNCISKKMAPLLSFLDDTFRLFARLCHL